MADTVTFDIAAVEDAIVERLAERLPDLRVMPFPGQNTDIARIGPLQKGVILAAYAGTSRAAPRPMDSILQQATVSYGLTLMLKDLRDHAGAYATIGRVLDALSGFCAIDDRPLFCTEDRFLTVTPEGIWIWLMSFSFVTWDRRVSEVEG